MGFISQGLGERVAIYPYLQSDRFYKIMSTTEKYGENTGKKPVLFQG